MPFRWSPGRGMCGVHHAACPVAFRLLETGDGGSHVTELLHEEVAVAVVRGEVLQHLGKSGEHPSVATCPEVLLAVRALVTGVDILRVAVVQVLVRIEHGAVGVGQVLMELVEVASVVRHLVELRHDGHHHVESVAPPPVVAARRAHLIFHHFACPAYLAVVGGEVVEVNIRLEAHLPVSEEHMVVGLPVGELPPGAVVAACSHPAVVGCPGLGVHTEVLVTGQEVGFHVARVVGGVVPEGVCLGFVFRLPVPVDPVDELPHLGSIIRLGGKGGSRKQEQQAGCKGLEKGLVHIDGSVGVSVYGADRSSSPVCGRLSLLSLSADCAGVVRRPSGKLPTSACQACQPCSIRCPNNKGKAYPDGRY